MVRETSYFGEDNNNSKNAQFLLGSPMSLCTAVLSAGPGLCPESAWPQELQPSPLSLTCPMAPAPISTQQQRVDVCGCIQRKGLPWPLLRFLRFLFPNPHKHGGVTTLPWTSSPSTGLFARCTREQHRRTSLKWAHFLNGHTSYLDYFRTWAWSYRHLLKH